MLILLLPQSFCFAKCQPPLRWGGSCSFQLCIIPTSSNLTFKVIKLFEKPYVEIFTDGSCSGNPGAGGWGAVLRYNGVEKELSGGEAMTTNNKMELTAVIESLKALKKPCRVKLTTDSKYVCDGINQGWAVAWRLNGWRKSDKKPALNVEYWSELLDLLETHEVEFFWVKGHAGHPENERCDALAVAQTKKYLQQQG